MMIRAESGLSTSPAEVAPGVFRIKTPLEQRFTSLYLVAGSTGVLLYDTGVDGTIPTHVLPALAAIDRTADDVMTVVVSHCDVDHFGGVADARAAFPAARIVAGAADVPLIEDFDRYLSERARGLVQDFGWDEDAEVLAWCRSVTREGLLDGSVGDGAVIDLGGRVATAIALPGHTRGHVGIDLGWANAVLVGDAVLGSSVNLADGSPAFPPTYRDVDDYLRTIARLKTLDRHLLLTAHYPILRGITARDFLTSSHRFVDEFGTQVLEHLHTASAPVTFAELVRTLNSRVGEWPRVGTDGALAFPVAGHLERLVAAGRVRRTEGRNGVAAWVAA